MLSFEKFGISFGDAVVVRELGLTLEKGEILALVGESGSGKTLTAHAILKLLPETAQITGDIRFHGTSIVGMKPSAIQKLRGNRIGMIFQEPMTALNPLHTIQRQIIEPFCHHRHMLRGDPRAKRKLAELLDAVGLSHLKDRGQTYPHQLSGGERQRAMIAMAIANDPDLLIADEPTTALDVGLQRQILALLRDLQRARGMGMLFITHDLPMVRAIATHVAVMKNGRIVETGSVEDIFTNAYHPYTQQLLQAEAMGQPHPIRTDAVELLRCDNLSVRFPVKTNSLTRNAEDFVAVQNVSLRLRAGETLGIIGESGSGKSTLALALLRLVESTGTIVFLSSRIDGLDAKSMQGVRRNLQVVFQDPYGSLNPRMTVGEIIAEGLSVHREMLSLRRVSAGGEMSPAGQMTPSMLVDEILTRVGLDPAMKSRYPHAFSGGQRQRIAIARAMILRPKLVVLDEPTSALDMTVQHQVLGLLRELQQTDDTAYLFISHDLRVIRSVSHRVAVMQRGQIVEQGEAETLFTHPQHPYTAALLAAAFGEADVISTRDAKAHAS